MTRDTEQTVYKCEFVNGSCVHCEATERGDCQGWVSSPKREWVGLTDEELDAIYLQHHNQYAECESPNWGYERAMEAKLKERNT